MPTIWVFALSLVSTIVVSAVLLWWGTKWIGGFKAKVETVFWVSLVTQVYRCVASLGIQYLMPGYPLWGFALVLCTMVYVQALALRLAVGVASHELTSRKAHLISLLTVLIGFVGVQPVVAWLVKQYAG